jgi:ABC-2 type transport system ATP-binding protein
MAESTAGDGLALRVRGLRKSYGSVVALNGLDLSVPRGLVYGFLGPNGAGKTTTMRVLVGLIHADGGTIDLFGQPFSHINRRRLFDVGALIESPSFYPYLSGRRNLQALAASGARVSRGRIEELLDLVALRDRAGDRVSTYSMGMRQRLGIAGALLSDPQLLLLDEPANGLDPAGIVAMRDMLKRLAAAGKTVFISSHILGEVRQLADVVGIIAAGRLVREAAMDDLLAGAGQVRVRVPQAQVVAAQSALSGIGQATLGEQDDGHAWLSVPAGRDAAADVTRALADAGIYLSGMETEGNLEALFLELTGGQSDGDATPAPDSPPNGFAS